MLPLLHSVPFHPFPFILYATSRKSPPGLGCPKRKIHLVVVGAVEKESEFEVDPVQAREALRKLDQQFQSLATKPDNPATRIQPLDKSRIQPLDKPFDFSRMREEADSTVTGFSESFLVNFSTLLLIFTVFYNILFITVIKPSVDGPGNYEEINLDEEVENPSPSRSRVGPSSLPDPESQADASLSQPDS